MITPEKWLKYSAQWEVMAESATDDKKRLKWLMLAATWRDLAALLVDVPDSVEQD